MDVLQEESRSVIPPDLSKAEVPCSSVRIHFRRRPAALPGQCMAHSAERFFIQEGVDLVGADDLNGLYNVLCDINRTNKR